MKYIAYIAVIVNGMYWLVYPFCLGMVDRFSVKSIRYDGQISYPSGKFAFVGCLYAIVLALMVAYAFLKRDPHIFIEPSKKLLFCKLLCWLCKPCVLSL